MQIRSQLSKYWFCFFCRFSSWLHLHIVQLLLAILCFSLYCVEWWLKKGKVVVLVNHSVRAMMPVDIKEPQQLYLARRAALSDTTQNSFIKYVRMKALRPWPNYLEWFWDPRIWMIVPPTAPTPYEAMCDFPWSAFIHSNSKDLYAQPCANGIV